MPSTVSVLRTYQQICWTFSSCSSDFREFYRFEMCPISMALVPISLILPILKHYPCCLTTQVYSFKFAVYIAWFYRVSTYCVCVFRFVLKNNLNIVWWNRSTLVGCVIVTLNFFVLLIGRTIIMEHYLFTV